MTDTLNDPSYAARRAILDRAVVIAAFDGWTSKTLRDSVKQANLPKGAAALYFPDGVLELIGFWGGELNAHVEETLAGLDLDTMKIRDKVTAGVTRARSCTNLGRGRYDLARYRRHQHRRELLFETHDTLWRDKL